MKRVLAVVGAGALALGLSMSSSEAAPAASTPTVGSSPIKVTKSTTGSYIVVMKADPLVKSVGVAELHSSAARSRKAAMRAAHAKVLTSAGIASSRKVQDYTNALNGFAVRTDLRGAERLARTAGVAAVLPDELRHPAAADTTASTSSSGGAVDRNGLNSFLGLTAKGQAYAQGITGRGVLVGVIDTGIWPESPSLAANPKLPPAPTFDTSERSACDFGNTAWNPNDKPFTCNNKLVGAREFLDTYKANTGLEPYEFDSARDDDGHGTHTATTAAGNADVKASVFGVSKGVISGIAPDAQVIAYKALGEAGGYTSDLAGAIDQAVADGVDVINYSIGGGAATVTADTIAFLFAADAGVFTAVAAGNDGPGAATIGGPADVPWVTSVGATTYPTLYRGVVRLGNGVLVTGASITPGLKRSPIVNGAAAGSELCLPGALDPAKVRGRIVLCGRGQNGRVDKSFAVQQAGGVGMVLYNQTDVDNLFSDNFFVPTVMIDKTPSKSILTYLRTTKRPVASIENRGVTRAFYPTPTVALFSSRGENPTAGDIVKPDISAPGVQILAGNTPDPVPGTQPSGQLFQAIAGTSMASPVVAGTLALLKQAHPTWSAAEAKSAIMTTAYQKVRDNDRKTQAGPFAMGAGLAMLGKPSAKGSAFQPGLVYDAGFDDYLGFLCAEGPEVFVDPAATCAALAEEGIPTTAADLNLASIGIESVPGSATVTRTVTSVASTRVTYRPSVSAPAGYTVQVKPATLTLAPGQSATFTVTVVNRGSAPVGTWRFGALTWAGGGYSARSPIAVKASAIKAPAEVSGSGVSGSVAVPVEFGIGGRYEAKAYGLVPQTTTPGTISQDPDQTFTPGESGPGVSAVPFSLKGVAHARWALRLDGDDDLDLYLLDSRGSVVASSTNGGTDEQIDLASPADGTYTLVVHGWAVAKPNTPYDLASWIVPATTGGTLSVTANGSGTVAPRDQRQVGLGWKGLESGGSYLGVLDHTIGGVSVASTLVTVTG